MDGDEWLAPALFVLAVCLAIALGLLWEFGR
jgi:hypothetical protein